ncbi:MAG TPA: AbrB family transcriptional regulator [Xanthobacteraceae bacterium]|nr:AbrB family transcriptional regulator [Xanthobacteraceae bacterium]
MTLKLLYQPPMLPVFALRQETLEVGETLLIAAAGGITFVAIGVPAGLVSGSVLAVATAALAGRPTKVPPWLARICFVIIGMLLGAVVTPETLVGIKTWPASVALLTVSTLCMTLATTSYLRFAHGWDSLSALLGASPGAMAQVVALAAEFGADMRGVAIVQTVRVLVITIGVPGGLALFGFATTGIVAVPPPPSGSSPYELALIAFASSLGAWVMARLRFPGGLLFGAMAGSAVLHGTGYVHAVLPWWVGSSAVVMLGAVVGARFANATPRMLFGYIGAALGSAAVATAVAACFVLIVTRYLPFRPADVAIAFAPGAQDTMMVLALALRLDPVYVGAHQLARWLVVTFSVALSARQIARWKPKASAGQVGQPDGER